MTMEVDSEALLKPRVEGAVATSKDRATAEYQNHSERFVIPQAKRAYIQQYAQLYFTRLKLLEPRVRAALQAQVPTAKVVRSLDLETGMECVLLGTLYKDMCLKPSILDEYSKERAEKPLVKAASRVSNSDFLVLEDENSRVHLVGDALHVNQLSTGVVCGVMGQAQENGDFQVSKLFFPAPNAPLARPLPPAGGPRRMLALVSGLKVGSGADPLRMQIFFDHLAGLSGAAVEQDACAEVVRLVIAGECTHPLPPPAARAGKKVQHDATVHVRELDACLAQLAAALPVDVMPGATDLTNVSLPQQPLNRCLFPHAAALSTFSRVTNPYNFQLAGVEFLGTSGQNVDDLDMYTSIGDRLDVMETTLRWQHLAPSAPDTLAMYPFADEDPFIVERAPAVYFVGNQPQFGTRVVEANGHRTRLVTLPSFAATGMVVLVDIATLAVEPMVFSADAFAMQQ